MNRLIHKIKNVFKGNVTKKPCVTREKHVNFHRNVSDVQISSNAQNLEDSMLIQKFLKVGHLKFYSLEPDVFNSFLHNSTNQIEIFDTDILSKCKTEEEKTILLKKLFSEDMSLEFDSYNVEEMKWLCNRFMNRHHLYQFEDIEKLNFLTLMKKAEYFDKFLATKFQSVKRYSGEGAESMIVFTDELLKAAVNDSINDVVISMAHRGRNNLLTVLLNYPPSIYFRKMKGKSEFPNDIKIGTGDTFSHFYTSTDLLYGDRSIHVSLIPNPSHLESNIPVGAGKVRSKMWSKCEGSFYSKDSAQVNTLALFIHGDASVCGQGIVPESLITTNSRQFEIYGGIHLVVNNRVGFTTDTPAFGLNHVTDVARIIQAPVLHVDGFNVLEIARAARLAIEYRQKYHRDIFINLICYRKWGHNELDDPSITQPLMYQKINQLPSIPSKFQNELTNLNITQCDNELENWKLYLQESLNEADTINPPLQSFKNQWSNMNIIDSDFKGITIYNTGYNIERLIEIGLNSINYPDDFNIHKNVYKAHIQKRLERLNNDNYDKPVLDWATAEALSIGSLLNDGYNVRISGQDVGRGTFNHRHFVLTDQLKAGLQCIPFNDCWLKPNNSQKGQLEVANSILSEEAVLGFEFGMALDNPNNLIIWEAQFGDFFNGAQIIFDTFIGSAECKWLLQNGLVILLPHGYDGAGPEHSSCRIERFLQLTDSKETEPDSDNVNMTIVNPTTPAQYFHLLRRQLIRPFRKPLIIIAPKLILRSPNAVSSLNDLNIGTHFQHLLIDYNNIDDINNVTHVLLCSGKHYYTLKQYLDNEIDKKLHNKFLLIRLEQLCPFPITEIYEIINKLNNKNNSSLIYRWCQEEPRNMGCWQFVESRLRNMLNIQLQYAGRRELSTPAVGIGAIYKQECDYIVKKAFEI